MLTSSFSCFSAVIVLFLALSPPWVAARSTPEFRSDDSRRNNNKWQININRILDSRRGSNVIGISDIKKYFRHFGYLPWKTSEQYDDVFDAQLESAVTNYQSKYGLPVTGKLDFDTLSLMVAPRCGVADSNTATYNALHAKESYVFFPGRPRWTRQIPMKLTYALSKENLIDYIKISDIKSAFKCAFGKWAFVIPVSFTETDDYDFADIRIGFYSGDHGDGEPFDGVLGVLAHSFTPENGKFHLDAAERWAVNFETEKSEVAVDLESVALHEIGHLLGLSHSPVKDAVMYPTLKPRNRKLDLAVDDIRGVQALYGSNPNFTFASSLESDTSSNQSFELRMIGRSLWTLLMLIWFFNIA